MNNRNTSLGGVSIALRCVNCVTVRCIRSEAHRTVTGFVGVAARNPVIIFRRLAVVSRTRVIAGLGILSNKRPLTQNENYD